MCVQDPLAKCFLKTQGSQPPPSARSCAQALHTISSAPNANHTEKQAAEDKRALHLQHNLALSSSFCTHVRSVIPSAVNNTSAALATTCMAVRCVLLPTKTALTLSLSQCACQSQVVRSLRIYEQHSCAHVHLHHMMLQPWPSMAIWMMPWPARAGVGILESSKQARSGDDVIVSICRHLCTVVQCSYTMWQQTPPLLQPQVPLVDVCNDRCDECAADTVLSTNMTDSTALPNQLQHKAQEQPTMMYSQSVAKEVAAPAACHALAHRASVPPTTSNPLDLWLHQAMAPTLPDEPGPLTAAADPLPQPAA